MSTRINFRFVTDAAAQSSASEILVKQRSFYWTMPHRQSDAAAWSIIDASAKRHDWYLSVQRVVCAARQLDAVSGNAWTIVVLLDDWWCTACKLSAATCLLMDNITSASLHSGLFRWLFLSWWNVENDRSRRKWLLVITCLADVYTLCSEKKHPLTFSSISPWVMCGFKQKLQWINLRNGRLWPGRN